MKIEPLNLEHLDNVVIVHMAAFPGFFLCVLGRKFLREFYRAFLRDPGGLAYVACDERGQVLGIIAGPLDPGRFFKKLLLRRWWAFALASLKHLMRRPADTRRILRAALYRGESPSGRDRALLSSIAVLPEAQGKGIGRKLVSRWVAEAKRRGAAGCYLLTDANGNEKVNAFYQSLDWKLEVAYSTPEGRMINRYIFDFVQAPHENHEPLVQYARHGSGPENDVARRRLKRSFDILFSAFGLAVLSPLLVMLAIAIRIFSRGPAFFLQERIGQNGRPFRIVKFRTMVMNAQRLGPGITRDGDPRITRIGRFLRKAKLDELPQLWNVLKGEMSFVGPRPELACYVRNYTTEQMQVLALKPGVTDPATLEFRKEEELLDRVSDAERFYIEHCVPRKIELNLAYAEKANLWADLKIICRTLFVLGFGMGAGRSASECLGNIRSPIHSERL